jgi:carbamoyl-phosphate synthase large subunit
MLGVSIMITVLVTGCGGAIGASVVKALRMASRDLHIIGVDSDPYAACFHIESEKRLLNDAYIISRADHPTYISEIINLCRRKKVDVIFPCTDAELEKLSRSIAKINAFGIKVIISPPRTIKICRDKWLSYKYLNKYLPMVKSALPENGVEKAIKFTGLPAVIKPRLGWGASQIYKVNTAEEAKIISNSIQKPVIQEYVEGEEYTVDCLANIDGKIVCVVPRRRIKIYSGLSFQGITVRDEKIIELGSKMAQCIKFLGPFNFQVKKVDGKLKIFEINPRFSGTGILSVKAGANIPLLAVEMMCGVKIPDNISFNEGLIISRYFEEVFFKNVAMKNKGFSND